MYKEDTEMKKLLMSLIALIFVLIPTYVIAQEDEDLSTTNTKYFDISIERGGQSPWNKSVTYLIYVTPKIDSKETQILWDSSSAVNISPRHSEFVDLYKDQAYTFKAKVKPEKPGSYEITVSLIAWQHDTNYANTARDIITFNNDLIAQPVQPSYTYNLIAMYLIIALAIGGSILGIVIFGKKGLKKVQSWLTPPN